MKILIERDGGMDGAMGVPVGIWDGTADGL